jgi:hypothetical protein
LKNTAQKLLRNWTADGRETSTSQFKKVFLLPFVHKKESSFPELPAAAGRAINLAKFRVNTEIYDYALLPGAGANQKPISWKENS